MQIEWHENNVFIKPLQGGHATNLMVWTEHQFSAYELEGRRSHLPMRSARLGIQPSILLCSPLRPSTGTTRIRQRIRLASQFRMLSAMAIRCMYASR
jgi:hypothetical protein